MQEILSIIHNFIEDRPTLKANNIEPKRMDELFLEEVHEFLEEDDVEKKAREAVDVIWFLCSWAYLNGVDIEAEIREKGMRNILKRPAHLYTNGLTYEQSEQEVKKQWTPMQESFFYEL